MIVVALIALVNLCLILLGIELTFRPPTTTSQKLQFRLLFAGLALALIVLTVIQYKSDTKDRNDLTERLAAMTGKLDQQQKDFGSAENQYKDVIRQMANSTSPIQAALDAISEYTKTEAKNEYFNPAHLDEMLRNDQATLDQKHNNILARLAPVGDYALRTLSDQVNNYALSSGDKLASSYDQFPASVPASGQVSFSIGMASNKAWVFECLIFVGDGAALTIVRSGDVTLRLVIRPPSASGVGITYIEGGDIICDKEYALADYHQTVNELFGLMLARQAKDFPLTKSGN